MERNLLLLVFALGAVVWLCGFLTSGTSRAEAGAPPGSLSRFWIVAAIALPVIVFLATIPAGTPFFAAGHGFGMGFLLGGLAGLAGLLTTLRALRAASMGQPVSVAAAIAAPMGLALMTAVVPSLWMRDSLLDALCGVAIGWLCAALLTWTGLAARGDAAVRAAASVCITITAGASALFCALAGLGELRGLIDLVGKTTVVVHWSVAGLTFAGCLVVLLLLALLPATLALRIPFAPLAVGWIERGRDTNEARASARRAWRTGACALVALLVGRIIAARFAEDGDAPWKTKSMVLKPLSALLGPNPMFHVIALGVVAALLINWLVRDHYRETATVAPRTLRETNVLAVLTLAAAGMVAFQLIGGFGLSVLLTVLLLTVSLAGSACLTRLHEQTSDAPTAACADLDAPVSGLRPASQIIRIFLLGTILALYRLFSARFENELTGVGLTDHYALFGILFGSAIPSFLTAYLSRGSTAASDSDGGRMVHLVTTGILVLVLPTLLIALWGAKCVLALVIGLALSTVFEGSLLSALLALAVALALTQWTHHVLPLAQLTRDQKVTILFWTTVVSVVALLIAEYGGRMRRMIGRGDAAAPAEGGAR